MHRKSCISGWRTSVNECVVCLSHIIHWPCLHTKCKSLFLWSLEEGSMPSLQLGCPSPLHSFSRGESSMWRRLSLNHCNVWHSLTIWDRNPGLGGVRKTRFDWFRTWTVEEARSVHRLKCNIWRASFLSPLPLGCGYNRSWKCLLFMWTRIRTSPFRICPTGFFPPRTK